MPIKTKSGGSSAIDLFPTGLKIRPVQLDALTRVEAAFDAGNQFVLLEAPTGSGKSMIAIALARKYGRAFVATLTKNLQDQYMHDPTFEPYGLRVLKGRSAYRCKPARGSCRQGKVLYGAGGCPRGNECPYQMAKREAKAADIAVANYHALIYNGLDLIVDPVNECVEPRELLVLDEGHEIEDVLLDYVTVDIDREKHLVAGMAPFPDAKDLDGWWTWLEEGIDALRVKLATLSSPDEKATMEERIQNWQFALSNRDTAAWVVDMGKGKTWAKLQPVTAAPFGKILFRLAKRVLLMSATILDPAALCESTGIDGAKAEYVSVPCMFPAQNRPIRLFDLDMRKDARDESWPVMVEIVVDILRFHKDHKGLLLAPSRELLEYLKTNIAKADRQLAARLILASGEDRQSRYEEHLRSKSPTVLAAPGMWEGIDLRDDLSRFQIICGLPRPYWGSAQVQARAKLHFWWYDWKTMAKTVQGLGRSIRSESDSAVSYVLDSAFRAHMERRRGCLIPDWMKEAVVTG